MVSRLWTLLVVYYLVEFMGALPSCGVNPLGTVYKYTSITTAQLCQSNIIMEIASFLLLIYMPCDDRSTNSANYDEFIKYLGMMHAIIQDCDISSVYIIGDWNAGFNGNSVFGTELSSFCLEHGYVLSDIDHLGLTVVHLLL